MTTLLVAPTFAVVMVNEASVEFAGTTTVAGTLATSVSETESVTSAPPAGAGLPRTTVPLTLVPPVTVVESSAICTSAPDDAAIDSDADFAFAAVAVIVAVSFDAGEVVVITNCADCTPAGTSTLAGTVANELELDSATTAPPLRAMSVRRTVPTAFSPPATALG